MNNFDSIIVLGGGRNNEGNLTDLSKQRLDKGSELYHAGISNLLFAMGGKYSTYSPHAIQFPVAGAELRSQYLTDKGVPPQDIVQVPDGRDTIGEAFASRKTAKRLGLQSLLIVTSDKHMDRALLIFRRIYGDNFRLEGSSVPCGDLLNEREEKEYFDLVKGFFEELPKDIPTPTSWEQWYESSYERLYGQYKRIHEKYIMGGTETNQAYMGVRKENK